MTNVSELIAAPRSSDAAAVEADMLEWFRSALGFESVSGHEGEFTRWVADWGRERGLLVDLWQADERELAAESQEFARHLPLAGRPTLVLELPGDPKLPSLMFNAHADVVPPGDLTAWTRDPWSGTLADGLIYGRGACDAKGPLASALWAMLRLAGQPRRRGSVRLELVPGEEDCVGLGTLTSLIRKWNADALIVLEPTEQLPRCASRGGCRFEIELTGKSVHGTAKWLGRDALAAGHAACAVLAEMEADFGGEADDQLFAMYPFPRPITVDALRGGQWQGMVCDRCTCAGYFELLPGDQIDEWEQRFESEVVSRLAARGIRPQDIQVRFVERYQGHRLNASHPLCRTAAEAVAACDGPRLRWAGFNAGCEAGLRANRTNTPTLVWGPGSLVHAHAADEHVAWVEVRQVAEMFTTLADRWTRG